MGKRKTIALILCVTLTVTTIISGCRMKASEKEAPTVTAPVTTSEEAEPSAPEPSGEALTKAVEEISAPSLEPEEYPGVNGSTATLPLSLALYQIVTGASYSEAETAIEHTKTTNAYNSLIYGWGANLVLAYEPAPSVYDAMKSEGISLIIKPIGKDALVFMANEGNPVRSLTGQQIKDIYSGRIHNWSEVGGAGKNIQAFQRPEGSGSQTLMDKLVMQGAPMDPDAPASLSLGDMGELIEKVAAYNNQENALGYSVYFYARNMYEKPGLRFMAVDGVMPGNDTIKSGRYPYVNEFYAAIREDEPKDSTAHLLFDWLTTDDGQALVESLGYVGLEDVDKTLAKDLDDHRVGDAQITFTPRERFLLDGAYAYGTDGVMVLNEKMEVVDTIDRVRLPSNMEMADITRPVILEEPEEGLDGLYDLANKTWLIEPAYASLYYDDEGQLYGYLHSETGGKRMKLTLNGTDIKSEEVPGNVAGSHIWKEDGEQKTAQITDLSGNVIKTVDFREYGTCQYGYVIQNFYLAYGDNHDFTLFDETGEPVLNQDSIENGRKFSFGTISLDGLWLQGSWMDTGNYFIYDLVNRKVVTEPGDKISVYITDKDSHYIVENKQGIKVYQSDGTPLLAGSGHPYEYVLGGGYYAYVSDNRLIVEGGSPKKSYNLPVGKLDYGYHLGSSLFYLSSHGETGSGIYRGETCLMEGRNANWWPIGDFIVMNDGISRYMVADRYNGKTLYVGNDGSHVVRPFEKFLVTTRGSYLCVMDYQGRYALKQLTGYMTTD